MSGSNKTSITFWTETLNKRDPYKDLVLRATQCKDADWIRLAQSSGPWRTLQSTVNCWGAQSLQKIWKPRKNFSLLDAEVQKFHAEGPQTLGANV